MTEPRHSLNELTVEALLPAITEWAATKRWWPKEDSNVHLSHVLQLAGNVVVAILRTDSVQVQVPLVTLPPDAEVPQGALIAKLADGAVVDGSGQLDFWRAALPLTSANESSVLYAQLLAPDAGVVPLQVEQSNTSVLLEGPTPLIAKLFRVLHFGPHPEAELPTVLTQLDAVPALHAEVTYTLGGKPYCAAVIAEFQRGSSDGFDLFKQLAADSQDPTVLASEIGVLVAAVHRQLEESFGTSEVAGAEVKARIGKALAQLGDAVPASVRARAAQLVENVPETLKATRIHGDLHLGQLLHTPGGIWKMVDFEGEPLRSLEERRRTDSPLRDVAGVLRSFDYAQAIGAPSIGDADDAWTEAAQQAFLESYQNEMGVDADALDLYLLDKTLYELAYELAYRPDWADVPLRGLRRLTAS